MSDFKVGDIAVGILGFMSKVVRLESDGDVLVENSFREILRYTAEELRHATLEEREEFYRMQEDMAKEETLKNVQKWFGNRSRDFSKKFRAEYVRIQVTSLLCGDFERLKAEVKNPNRPVQGIHMNNPPQTLDADPVFMELFHIRELIESARNGEYGALEYLKEMMEAESMKQETTEQQPEPTYKVGDDVLVTGRITEIQDNGSIRVEYNTSSYPNDWNLYEPEKIHSLAPKEPVVDYGDYSFAGRVEKNGTIAIVKHQKEECRFEVGDPVLIWGSLVSGVVVNIDKMHDFMQIPNAIGVETDGVIRYFRQDDLRVRKEPAQSAKNNRVKGMNALREKILNDKEINLMSDEELIKELFELPPMKQTGVKPEAGKVVRFSDKEEITNFICHLQFAAGYFWAINKHEQSNNLMCLVKKLMGAD